MTRSVQLLVLLHCRLGAFLGLASGFVSRPQQGCCFRRANRFELAIIRVKAHFPPKGCIICKARGHARAIFDPCNANPGIRSLKWPRTGKIGPNAPPPAALGASASASGPGLASVESIERPRVGRNDPQVQRNVTPLESRKTLDSQMPMDGWKITESGRKLLLFPPLAPGHRRSGNWPKQSAHPV